MRCWLLQCGWWPLARQGCRSATRSGAWVVSWRVLERQCMQIANRPPLLRCYPVKSHRAALADEKSMCCCRRGLLDTGANVVTLRLWGSRAEPFVQSLHASFAVGALVAPLLAERFISQGQHSSGVAAMCDNGQSTPSVWLDGGMYSAHQAMPEQSEGNVKWAFWISSAIMIPSAISLTALTSSYARICRVSAAEAAAAAADGLNSPPRKRSVAYQRRLLGLGLTIFGLYVGAEIGCKSDSLYTSCSFGLCSWPI
eukprot:COSAG02_NODE_10644_length_1892_cov_362.277747_1_plen_255_part_00